MAKLTVKDIKDSVDIDVLMSRPLSDWRPILAVECQVYVFGENYLAKRFDQINFKFCEKNEAKEILIDNLFALLRYKYFPKLNEEIDDRINRIVASFTSNLKTTLKKVSFDKSSDSEIVEMLPDYCIAFRNGVFNFKDNKWQFRYNVVKLESLANSIYLYDPKYIILWYLDYEFDSFNIDLNKLSLSEFIEVMKESTKVKRNYCFELMYNIAHDESDTFSFSRFNHLCEILGYTMLQSFSQHFVMLIGSGQNGKNSLFDGCLTHRLIPRAAANDMDSIEQDRFITGSLENRAHNIFLESSAKTYSESKMIKALTGSMYQTIEQKGVSKYSGVINCKYIFAANDQDKVKFSDTTMGFRRRINMLEIWYTWDSAKRFLKRGDYYDTTFSDSLSEIKDDVTNTSTYVYFAMYGILSGTKGFTKNFQFTSNDWKNTYSDIDLDLKEKLECVTPQIIANHIKANSKNYEDCKSILFGLDKKVLYKSPSMSELGYENYDDMISMLSNIDASLDYFSENDAYISVRCLQSVIKDFTNPTAFTQAVKKIYSIKSFTMLSTNKPYIKCSFAKLRLKVIP